MDPLSWVKPPMLALLLLCSLLLQPRPAAAQTDAQLLLEFKATFSNGQEKLNSWDSSTDPCGGEWTGVVCSSKGVARVDLRDMGLEGTLPVGGWPLPPTVIQLALKDNTFTGELSPNFTLPPYLTELDLENTSLAGDLSHLVLPSSLQRLWLRNNRLYGDVSLLSLPEGLLELDASKNSLRGSIEALALPPGLQNLTLDFNDLTGSLSESWVLPRSLYHLGIGYNRISGTIPLGWPGKAAAGLRVLYMWGNPLGGSLPVGWELPNLEILDMSGCLFNGSIPSGFQLPDSLQMLILYNNSLEGAVPDDWPLPPQLKFLALQANQLTSLPPRWELPNSLYNLDVHDNRIQGNLLPSWALSTSLEWLDLSGNLLSGPLPEDWNGNMGESRLKNIMLSDNQLTGTLPSWWNLEHANVTVRPGNPKLCGEVPFPPRYVFANGTDLLAWLPCEEVPSPSPSPNPEAIPLLSPLPASSPPGASTSNTSTSPPASEGSSSNTAAIAGIVAGAIAIIAVSVLVWWIWRRKKLRKVRSKLPLTDVNPCQGSRAAAVPGVDLPTFKLLQGLTSVTPLSSTNGSSSSEAASKDTLVSAILSKLSTGGSDSNTRKTSTSDALGVDAGAWTISFQELSLVKQIGEGSFGRVYLADWNATKVAVKLLLGPAESLIDAAAAADMALSLHNPVLAALKTEASVMASLRHPNILGFMGVCCLPPCLVSEYCTRGSLLDVLREAKSSTTLAKRLTWQRRLRMAEDAAKGMLYLHAHHPPLVHRDLKSPNLLVSHNWEVKVADFNLAKITETQLEGSTTSTTAVTNPRWLAPEVLAGQRATFASDCFSFGIVLWELLTWEVPWSGHTNVWQVAKHVIEGGRLAIPPAAEVRGGGFKGLDAYTQLIQWCWAHDPKQRPSFAQIIAELRSIREVLVRTAGEEDQEFGD